MSELGGDSGDGLDTGGEGVDTGGEGVETGGASGETEVTGSSGLGEATGTEGMSALAGDAETSGGKGAEGIAPSSRETFSSSHETTPTVNQILETPLTLEQAQKDVEAYHQQSIAQILQENGKYMSESDRARIANGVQELRAVEHDPWSGRTGGYRFSNGRSNIEVSAIDQRQMERSTKHETNHFASKNREIIVPEPDKKGYTVYNSVGLRRSSWFHSNETGLNSEFTTKGRGMNEGVTTMFTNQQLTELSKEKGEAAAREGIYPYATELCAQLESIVGEETLKEAYYGGNLQGLEAKVDALAGEKGFEALSDALDRSISQDPVTRVQGMKDAQAIIAKMYEAGGETK